MTHADLVFTGGVYGGRVFRSDASRGRADAVAVRAGRIVALDREAVALIGPGTQVVDLDGRMLLPGFQDAHVHPLWGGLDMLRCDLADLSTQDAYLQRIAQYAAAHPDDWVLGGGWQMSAFPGGTPTAVALDRVVPDRPAFLPNRDGHGAWVNSRALALAGITRDTPDPDDGRIERDATGSPTGTLHEGAMTLVNRLLPAESHERLREALAVGQRYLHSFGITAWQDAIVGTQYSDAGDPLPVYIAADRAGELTGRVVGSLWWDRTRGLEQIDDLVALRESAAGGGRFAATSIKIMQDGVAENFTAAMLEPYCDGHGHPTENAGISFVEPAVLNEAAARLDALGFTLHFHAIGDRAVRECLDAVESALRRNGPRGNPHHISHIQVVHPDDVPRFRRLGVTANMQMLWATLEPQMVDLTLPFLGDRRSSWQYPFGDLLRSGAALAAGSDWSVSTPDPMAAIHTAVNRRSAPSEWEGDYPPFLPEQAIDLGTALQAYTAGSARVNSLPETGTIRVGMLADLALLDRDPFEGEPEQIGETRVLGTWVEGVPVFEA